MKKFKTDQPAAYGSLLIVFTHTLLRNYGRIQMKRQPKITIHSFAYRHNIGIKSLRLQWGDSSKSLGSFVVANIPADLLIDSDEEDQQKKLAKILLKNTDIKYIIKTVKAIYKSEELNGFLEIYHLSSELMISPTLRSLLTNPVEIFPSAKEIAVHPWICICWGDKFEIEVIKHIWLKNIVQSGVLLLGKRDSSYNYPELNSVRVMRFIINQYRKVNEKGSITGIIVFPVSAAKPNIHIPRRITEDFVELYESNGLSEWHFSLENPEDIVYSFSQLTLKDGFKLRAYQHSMGVAGAGLIYAIPSDSSLPEIPYHEDIPSEPEDALEDFMEAIEGDHSPLSYLQAAICYHELHEFGAYWHSVRWGAERILPDEAESPYDNSLITNAEDLKENGFELKSKKIPDSLLPRFYYEDGKPVVIFYTINSVGIIEFIRYKHVFSKEGYKQEVTDKVLGIGRIGIMF